MIAGCEQKQDGGDDEKKAAAATPTLTVEPAKISAPAGGESYTFALACNTVWSAAVNSGATWCAVAPNAGTGNGTGTVRIAENRVVTPRAATVTFASGTLTRTVAVTQEAAAPALEVDKTTITANVAAATHSIGVTSNTTWTATVNSGATWCTLKNSNGTGDGTINVNVAGNPTIAPRGATVTVKSGALTRTVAVTQAADAPTLEVDKPTITASVDAYNYAIAVTSNTTWAATVSSDVTWCTLNFSNGTGNGTITVNVAANPTVATRTATVTIGAGALTKTVTVTQAADAPALEVDKPTIDAAAAASNYAIAVTSNTTWAATVSSGATWCTLTNDNGTGNGEITVNVAANPTVAVRTATVTIGAGALTKTVTVTQGAGAPTLEVDKTSIPATAAESNHTIAVTSNTTWAATVSSGATWCTLANNNATGNGTVTVNVAANPTVATRTATVTITNGTLTKTITVTQAAAAPTLEVDKTTIDATAAGANNCAITVTSNVTWTATVSSGATWCTLTKNNDTGNGTITVNVAENPKVATRTATVTVKSGTLTKTITVTQAAAAPTLEVDKTTINAAVNSGNYPITVNSNSTWTANISSGATWCTLTNNNATGNGTITVNVAENLMAFTRSATVTVTSGTLTKTVAVTQAAAALVLNVDKITIDAAAGTNNYPITVTSNATWTATVSSGATWCTLTKNNDTGNSTITVNVAANPTVATRTATVTVKSGTLTKTITVTQGAGAPVLTVNSTYINAAVAANNYPITVTSNVTWTATVNSGATWCTLTNADATGNGTITVNVAENPTFDARNATVIIAAGTLTNTITLWQNAVAPTLEVDQTTIATAAAAASYTINVTSNTTWTASGYPHTITPNSGTGDGTVLVGIVENTKAVAHSSTITFTSGKLRRIVAVNQEAYPTPKYAASTMTWDSAYRLWSDAIQVPTCNKTSFQVSDSWPGDCRSDTNGEEIWYYYNWPYVRSYRDTLCPPPWRVPDYEDAYILYADNNWTHDYLSWLDGGYYTNTSNTSYYALYWTDTQYSSETAWTIDTGYGEHSKTKQMYTGSQVRCVRSK
jgi:hypothetical protein